MIGDVVGEIAADERGPRRCAAGRSLTGRGMPDICFGSGICELRASASAAAQRTQSTQSTQRRTDVEQGRSSGSRRASCRIGRVARVAHRTACRTCASASFDVRARRAAPRAAARCRRSPERCSEAFREIAARSASDNRPRRRAAASDEWRAREAARSSRVKSSSDIFSIARSNSSSLIARSVSIFSRSSAARVRSPIIAVRSPSACTSGRTVRRPPGRRAPRPAIRTRQEHDDRDTLRRARGTSRPSRNRAPRARRTARVEA